MKKKTVGIIYGGKSVEHEVSLQSAKSVYDAIDREKFIPILIGVNKEGRWSISDEDSFLYYPQDINRVKLKESSKYVAIVPGAEKSQFINITERIKFDQIDVIFPIIHGNMGEDGTLQGILNSICTPYVGCDVIGSAICMDKDVSKRLMQSVGIRVARGYSFTANQRNDIKYELLTSILGKTLFVKPANSGSSVGVSKVTSKDSLDNAINLAFQFDNKIIIEELIIGREIEFSVLGNENPIVSLPGEVIINSDLYSYKEKYQDKSNSKFIIPAKINESKIKQMQEVSVLAYKTLQCQGLARIDFFLTDNGDFFINEINTLPGLTESNIYPKLWAVSGITYSNLITRLIELAIERFNQKESLIKSLN